MRYLSFLLIISLFLCYTGLASDAHHSASLNNTENNTSTHHEAHGHKVQSNHSKSTVIKIISSEEHEGFECCAYALPNAPHDFDLGSGTVVVISFNFPTLKTNKAAKRFSNSRITEEHGPPMLFLLNSSFLI